MTLSQRASDRDQMVGKVNAFSEISTSCVGLNSFFPLRISLIVCDLHFRRNGQGAREANRARYQQMLALFLALEHLFSAIPQQKRPGHSHTLRSTDASNS